MSIAELPTRTADTSAPLLGVLADRWSPRAFDASAPVDELKLTAALEAARWSPSANNSQPWRFIVVRRGTPEFDTVTANLMGFNQAWAGSAGVLIVALAETVDESGNGAPLGQVRPRPGDRSPERPGPPRRTARAPDGRLRR